MLERGANPKRHGGLPHAPAPVKETHRDRSRSWRHQFVRRCVLNDCYRPHTPQELEALVERGHMAPEVAAKATEGCGVWWYEGRDFEGTPTGLPCRCPPRAWSGRWRTWPGLPW